MFRKRWLPIWALFVGLLLSSTLGCQLTGDEAVEFDEPAETAAEKDQRFWNRMSRMLHAPALSSDKDEPLHRSTTSTGWDPKARDIERSLGVYGRQ